MQGSRMKILFATTTLAAILASLTTADAQEHVKWCEENYDCNTRCLEAYNEASERSKKIYCGQTPDDNCTRRYQDTWNENGWSAYGKCAYPLHDATLFQYCQYDLAGRKLLSDGRISSYWSEFANPTKGFRCELGSGLPQEMKQHIPPAGPGGNWGMFCIAENAGYADCPVSLLE